MAIYTDFLSVIIPIEKIKACKSVGGFMGILEIEKDNIGKKIYFDDYLYRDGAMGSHDIETIVKFWEKHGLVGIENVNGEDVWKDMCVVDMCGGPTLPCDWLEFELLSWPDGSGIMSYTYMRWKAKGEIIYPNHIHAHINND